MPPIVHQRPHPPYLHPCLLTGKRRGPEPLHHMPPRYRKSRVIQVLELRQPQGEQLSARKTSLNGLHLLFFVHFHFLIYNLRIMDLPSAIAFEIALFPHNVPLPAPQTSARLSAGVLHLFHLLVRISQLRRIPDSDLGWEDMYREEEGHPWFDWVSFSSLLIHLHA